MEELLEGRCRHHTGFSSTFFLHDRSPHRQEALSRRVYSPQCMKETPRRLHLSFQPSADSSVGRKKRTEVQRASVPSRNYYRSSDQDH